MTDCIYTHQIFCEGRTQVSGDEMEIKDFYAGLDKTLFGLKKAGDQLTIYVRMEQLDRFPDLCRRVRKHLGRFG